MGRQKRCVCHTFWQKNPNFRVRWRCFPTCFYFEIHKPEAVYVASASMTTALYAVTQLLSASLLEAAGARDPLSAENRTSPPLIDTTPRTRRHWKDGNFSWEDPKQPLRRNQPMYSHGTENINGYNAKHHIGLLSPHLHHFGCRWWSTSGRPR